MLKIPILIMMLCMLLISDEVNMHHVNVGKVIIEIPEPQALKEISYILELKPYFDRLGSSANKVLAAYLSSQYVDSFPNVTGESPSRWATIIIDKKIENSNATSKNYTQLIEHFKKDDIYKKIDMKKLNHEAKALTDEVKEDYDVDVNLTFNVARKIPNKDYETNNYYGFMSLMKVNDEYTILSSTTILLIKQRIVSLNMYTMYNSNQDIDKLRYESRQWLDEIVKSNSQ